MPSLKLCTNTNTLRHKSTFPSEKCRDIAYPAAVRTQNPGQEGWSSWILRVLLPQVSLLWKGWISVQSSCSVVSNSLWPMNTKLPCPPTPGVCSNSCLSSRWCYPTLSSSVIPFSSCLQSFPASGFFQAVSSSHQVAKVLELQLQHQSFQWIFRTGFLWDLLVGSPCSPRDSEESSSTPQFKIINSLVLSFLYNPILTSIHNYWKNYSFD